MHANNPVLSVVIILQLLIIYLLSTKEYLNKSSAKVSVFKFNHSFVPTIDPPIRPLRFVDSSLPNPCARGKI